MNVPRYLITAAAAFVFIFLYEMFIHGFLFMGLYEATAGVWRGFAEMEANMPLAMLFQLALAVWTTFGFTQIYKEGGIKNGLLFGLYFGVFAGILTSNWYLWLPVPLNLGLGWFFMSVVEGLGVGAILGSLYKGKAKHSRSV